MSDARPRHFGFLSTEYPPLRSGGIGINLRNQARALVDAGHRVSVVGWGASDERFSDRGVEVRFLRETRVPRLGWLLNRRRAAAVLERLAREDGLCAVEAHDWCGPSAGMRLPCAVAVRIHGSATYFGDLLGEPVRRSVRWAEARALAGADAVGAVSRFAAERTQALFGLRRLPDVVPNGIDVDRFAPSPLGPDQAGRLLYFGTLVRKKGVLDLCRAFPAVLARVPSARLRLVGRDAADSRTGGSSTVALARDALARATRTGGGVESDLREAVDFAGPLPNDEIPRAIADAALCVFPSYAEALPLVWLEAMACGRPVVAYDIGWAREIVDDGIDGVLVPAGDVDALAAAVAALLGLPDRLARMGRAAREKALRFDARAVARETAAWLANVADSRRGARPSPRQGKMSA